MLSAYHIVDKYYSMMDIVINTIHSFFLALSFIEKSGNR